MTKRPELVNLKIEGSNRSCVEAASTGTLRPAKISRRDFNFFGLASAASLVGCGGGGNASSEIGTLALDPSAKSANPDPYTNFEWYKWTFPIDPDLDTVGAKDGFGQLFVRLFTPRSSAGSVYPLVANLGGLGDDANIKDNFYADTGQAFWANDAFQTKYPSYVLTITVPWEACVNYEAEMAYMYQIGELIKAIGAKVGNLDMARIYATGVSQGAGWSYEAAAAQPDLFAALFINSGTVVHSTWGDVLDYNKLKNVDLHILHGTKDIYIPPNEAFRVYNALKASGKSNLQLTITEGGHGLIGSEYFPIVDEATIVAATEVYAWQDWLFSRKKGVALNGPILTELPHTEFVWAGSHALAEISTWATDIPYATWIEPQENATWTRIRDTLAQKSSNGLSSGSYVIGRFRIGDETQTTFDDPTTLSSGLTKGQTLCMTVQGYTGAYGDDLIAFNREWTVDWAVMVGQVTSIKLTSEASPVAIARPSSVDLTNGGGPNQNNSLATPNVLDGKQVYLKIALADSYTSNSLKMFVRFTRRLGAGVWNQPEFASYWHAIDLAVG